MSEGSETPARRAGSNVGASPRRGARHWLLKSEPGVFSFEDLLAAPAQTTGWEGVRNYQARNLLRDDVRVGDLVLFYHSNATPTGVAGVAEVIRGAHADPTQFEPTSEYFDRGSDTAAPRWLQIEVRAVQALPRFVSLADLKACPELADMAVVQRGQRLSVQPVTPAEFARVLRMGGLTARSLQIGR